jgi:transcriptional regulator with XRE-family HTH domain
MSLSKQLGERIRSVRKGKKISQEELAEKASVYHTFIGQIERGEKGLSLDTLESVIKALDISLGDIGKNLPFNVNNVEEIKLELLINRLLERNPKKREALLKIFLEILDLDEK